MPRARVTKSLVTDLTSSLEGSIPGAIAYLDSLYEDNKDTYDSIYIENDGGYDYQYLSLFGSRLETDAEYQNRVDKEMARLEKERAKDLKEYEKIKKKYKL